MPAELGPGPGRVSILTEQQDFGEIAAKACLASSPELGFWSYVATPSSSCWPGRARIRQAGQRTLASGGPAADLRRRLGRSAQRRGVRVGNQNAAEVAARGDVELGEDLTQVILDGAPGQEQPGADLRVRQAVAGQLGDLGLLGSQLKPGGDGAFAGGLAGGLQL